MTIMIVQYQQKGEENHLGGVSVPYVCVCIYILSNLMCRKHDQMSDEENDDSSSRKVLTK